MRTHISVIIVNYNSGSLLARSLEALALQTHLADRIVVVDNNSQDGSLDDLPDLAGLEIIRLDANLGFARANNLAISKIQDSDYLVLLNPDAFVDKNFLQAFIHASQQHPDEHFFAAKMIDDQSREYYDGAGDVYSMSGRPKRRYHGCLLDSVLSDKNERIFSPCAGAAMYTRSSFQAVGGFDDSFFCYMEDIDLGFRMQLMGYSGIYVPDAIVYHIGSAISGRQSDFSIYYGHRNLVWTYIKNMPMLLLLFTLPFHLILNLVTIVYFFLRGKGRVIIRAKKDALFGIPRVWKQRRAVQNSKVVSNWYIWSILNKKFSL